MMKGKNKKTRENRQKTRDNRVINSLLIFLLLIGFGTAQAQNKPSKKDYVIEIKTDFGTMHGILYDETPKHKANFIKLVDKKFFDGLLFHRIIEQFMIQGGDPTSRNASADAELGNGGNEMGEVPYEFTPLRYHKKGVIAAARDNYPDKHSSACQFYIVQGKQFDEKAINAIISRNKMDYTPEQKAVYATLGGTPHLDNNYTVFGEIIDNLQVIDSIAKQARNAKDRPVQDIKMSISQKKMRKKKITKLYGYQYN